MKKSFIFSGLRAKKGMLLRFISFFFWLFFISQFVLLALPQTVRADLWSGQEGLSTDIGPKAFDTTTPDNPERDIRVIVAKIILVFLGLLGLLFLTLTVLAGYKWMMAQGDSSKVDEAKEQLRTSVIGLAIILASWGITRFVINSILKATDPNFIWPI